MSNSTTQQVDQQFSSIPCFFFSYARKDVDRYLLQFFEDLSSEVAQKGALDPEKGQVSFRDIQNIEPGQDWENQIAQALQHSKVLVCVYTPWYFQREYCGKEFHIFLKRNLKRNPSISFEDGYFRDSVGILPIFWLDKCDLNRRKVPPLCLSRIQVFDPDPDESNEQKKRGLRQILKNEGRRRKYWGFVEKLAGRILDIYFAEETLPSLDTRPTFRSVKSIFCDLSDWERSAKRDTSTKLDMQKIPVLPMPGEGLRVFLLSYAAVGGDNEFTCESLASCSISRFQVGELTLPSGAKDTIGSVIDGVAFRCGFGCQELLINSAVDSVVEDITQVLKKASALNTVIVMIFGDQAMPNIESMVRLQRAIQDQGAFVVALSLFDRQRMSVDLETRFKVSSERILSAELDIADYESNISQVFESLLIGVKSRILESGDVKRTDELSGLVEKPLIRGPGSGGIYE